VAKKLRSKIAEVKEPPSIFMSIELKDLPPDVKARHLARKKKIDANHKENQRLNEEGEADVRKLVKRIKDAKAV